MKENLRFNFQSFEIDSEFDGKPQAFAKAFWRGEEREFALALVDGYVRFCEVDHLESGEWNFAVNGLTPHFSTDRVQMPFVENIFRTALKKNEVGRLFYFAAEFAAEIEPRHFMYGGKLNLGKRIFIGLKNNGFFQSGDKKTYFENMSALSLELDSASKWYAELENLTKEVESDLGFSNEWHQLMDNERAWKIIQLKNGNRLEMERIASLILSLDDQLREPVQADYWECLFATFKLGKSDQATRLKSVYLSSWDDLDNSQSDVISPLWEIFLRHFEPRINAEIYEKYSAPKLVREYELFFRTDIPEFTRHEQIEVFAEINKWLQGKVPDDQINSLLA